LGHWALMQVQTMVLVLAPICLEELSVVCATHGRRRVWPVVRKKRCRIRYQLRGHGRWYAFVGART
jgi:hypothetical protein